MRDFGSDQPVTPKKKSTLFWFQCVECNRKSFICFSWGLRYNVECLGFSSLIPANWERCFWMVFNWRKMKKSRCHSEFLSNRDKLILGLGINAANALTIPSDLSDKLNDHANFGLRINDNDALTIPSDHSGKLNDHASFWIRSRNYYPPCSLVSNICTLHIM